MRGIQDFAQRCNEQAIGLHRRIEKGSYSGKRPLHAPTDFLKSIAEAGRILRLHPNKRLAHTPLTPDDFADLGQPAIHLAGIVRDSVSPVEGEGSLVFTSTERTKGLDTCSFAEKAFAAVILNLQDEYKRPPDEDAGLGCQIITDKGKPVMIRKGYSVSSALLLEQVVVNGVRLRAGSIAKVTTEPGTGVFSHQTTRITTDSITSVTFLRETAWAVDCAERQKAFPNIQDTLYEFPEHMNGDPTPFTPQEIEFVYSATLDDIRARAASPRFVTDVV